MAATDKSTGSKTSAGTKKTGSAAKKNDVNIPKLDKGKKQTSRPAPKSEAPKRNDEKYQSAKRQKTAIVLFAAAVLVFCLAVVKGESAWLAMHGFFLKVFGMCAFVCPVALVYLSVVYAKNKTIGSVAANLTGGGIFILLFGTLVHIFGHLAQKTADGVNYLSAVGIKDQIAAVWNSPKPGVTGGVLGAAFGGLFCTLLGQTGALVVTLIMTVVVLMFVTGMTLGWLAKAVAKPVIKVNELTNEKIERGVELREQREREKKEKKFAPPESADSKKKKKAEEAPTPTEIVRDESTFAGTEHEFVPTVPPIADPVIPVLSIPDEEEKGLDSALHAAEAEKKEKKKAPKKGVPPKAEEDETFVPPQETLRPEMGGYEYPPVECLNLFEHSGLSDFSEEMNGVARKLISTLESFGVKAQVVDICRGPSVTRYEIEPDEGVRISRVTKLADDIALRLASSGVRISAIPDKTAIGIEVPNRKRETVGLREVIDSEGFRNAKSKLNVALGKDIAGNLIFADLAKMPHLLIAGTTGSGKSVCLNTMIISLLFNASPDEVKIVLIDPKQVEFTVYNGIGHLEVPVVSNPRKAAGALGWAVSEMEKRYQTFSENNVRDIKGYNRLCESRLGLKKMHHVVIFIDELSDLMMVAPNEVEESICRLAQMARAAGMHLVVATQRPSVNVITGVIKANIPSRISLSVSSQVDSRTILDTAGAEKLLGNGDMLFAPIGVTKPQRVQGCFISDEEVEGVVEFIKKTSSAQYNDDVIKEIDSLAAATENPKKRGASADAEEETDGLDETVMQALEAMIQGGRVSTTFLQNKLGWGYPKAARIMGQIEEMGFISPKEGGKDRHVLITLQDLYEMNANARGTAPSGLSAYAARQEALAEDDEDSDEDYDDGDYDEDGEDAHSPYMQKENTEKYPVKYEDISSYSDGKPEAVDLGLKSEEEYGHDGFADYDPNEDDPFADYGDVLDFDEAERPDEDDEDDF